MIQRAYVEGVGMIYPPDPDDNNISVFDAMAEFFARCARYEREGDEVITMPFVRLAVGAHHTEKMYDGDVIKITVLDGFRPRYTYWRIQFDTRSHTFICRNNHGWDFPIMVLSNPDPDGAVRLPDGSVVDGIEIAGNVYENDYLLVPTVQEDDEEGEVVYEED